MKTLLTDRSDRAAFLAHRRGKIGSSDIPTIAGLNKYKSPLQLWVEMTQPAKEPDAVDSLPIQIGRGLEQFIGGTLYPQKTGKKTTSCNAIYQANDLDWAIASPDFFVEDGRILETKCTGEYSADQWEDGVPNYAHIQVIWQMGVCDVPTSDVAALIGNRNFVVRTVAFSPTIYYQLVAMAASFMENVRSGIPPMARADDTDVLNSLFETEPGKNVVLPHGHLAREYLTLSEAITGVKNRIAPHREELKRLENELEAVENNIKLAMGDAEVALFEGSGTRFRRIRRERKGYSVAPGSRIELKLIDN